MSEASVSEVATPTVHLWLASLQADAMETRRILSVLSAEERARAARYRVDRLGEQFVLARAALRLGLARVLGVEPRRLQFAAHSTGKPYLAWPASSVEFSTARSDELAVGVCTSARRIGIDLERVVARPDLDEVARTRFTAAEVVALHAQPPLARTHAFYRVWTRKEAVLKALGVGLAAPLDAMPVEGVGLRVEPVCVAPGHEAALAVEASNWHLRTTRLW